MSIAAQVGTYLGGTCKHAADDAERLVAALAAAGALPIGGWLTGHSLGSTVGGVAGAGRGDVYAGMGRGGLRGRHIGFGAGTGAALGLLLANAAKADPTASMAALAGGGLAGGIAGNYAASNTLGEPEVKPTKPGVGKYLAGGAAGLIGGVTPGGLIGSLTGKWDGRSKHPNDANMQHRHAGHDSILASAMGPGAILGLPAYYMLDEP